MNASFNWLTSYDADKSLVLVTSPDSQQVSYNYDPVSGQLSSVEALGLLYQYLYDDIGRIKTIKSAYADQRGEIDYAWNGKLPLMTTWQGSVVGTVEYSWGTFDRLIGVAVNGTQAFSYTYTPEGEIETANSLTLHRTGIGILDQVSLGSIDTLYTANSFGEIIGANNTTASGPLISLNYQRDKLGRISSISSSDSTRTVTTHEYAYDAIGQLLEERINGQSIFTYSYDRNGNRRSNSGNEVYDEQDRLVSDSNWTYK